MTTSKALTGSELETLGLMKFSCDICRENFPRRCGEHAILPEGDPEPPKPVEPPTPKRALPLIPRSKKQGRVLQFGGPLLEYTAPYEALEADISAALRVSAQ